jgi:hypothetical protein
VLDDLDEVVPPGLTINPAGTGRVGFLPQRTVRSILQQEAFGANRFNPPTRGGCNRTRRRSGSASRNDP